MGNKRDKSDFRLYGKELFVIYPKLGMEEGTMRARGFTNKNQMKGKFGLGYDNLIRVFTRKKVKGERINYYEFSDAIVIRLFIIDITKGTQSLSRKGKGGRISFGNM